MALLNHAETVSAAPLRGAVAINWRLMLALGGTALFWAGVARGIGALI